MIKTPPQHNTENPPGQITYRPRGLYLRDVIKRIQREENHPERTSDWEIDHSAGRPILTYQKCSVIEAETAEYVMGLIKAKEDLSEPMKLPTPIAGPAKALADLKQALLGLCEYAESYDPKHPLHQIVYARDIRKIIQENT